LTYPKAVKLHALVKKLPLEQIVLETDSPDMKPYQWPDKINSPVALTQIFNRLAGLRTENADQLKRQLIHNTLCCFPRLTIKNSLVSVQ